MQPRFAAMNVALVLQTSASNSARLTARHLQSRLEEFLTYIDLSGERLVAIVEGDEATAEFTFFKVFPNGWLDQNGNFFPVEISGHERTAGQITGFPDGDAACSAGWVKFTVGIPSEQNGECLFNEHFSDRRLLSGRQKEWIHDWLVSISNPGSTLPTFE